MIVVEKKSIQEKVSGNSGMFAKYRVAMVGDGGNLALFLYELINFFCTPVPGILGVLSRRLFFPLLLGKIGTAVRIYENCTIRNGRNIVLGDNVCIEKEVTLDVKPGGNKIVLGDNVIIGNRVIFNCSGGVISIGDGTVVGSHCRLGSLLGNTIGCHCRIGSDSCIVGAGHATGDLEKAIVRQPITCNGPSIIGDYVSIGERVTLLDGVRVGSHVTICSDSLVLQDIPDNCTVSGVPAKIISKESVQGRGL